MEREHERLAIEPDWVDFDWWLVRCACGWYARRPTRQKCKREYYHHVAFARRAASVHAMTDDPLKACVCVHPPADHVIDMKAPVPLLRCIAFGCDCQVFASKVAKAS